MMRFSHKSSQYMVWYARFVFLKDVLNDKTFTNIEKFC